MTTRRDFYRTIPALAQYIDRIGATERNFRRWVIEERYGHYYKEQCHIRMLPGGVIECSDPQQAPTDAERAAIILAMGAGIELPRSIEIRPAGVQDLIPLMRQMQNGDPTYFEFYNQRTGNVIMVQQRIDRRDGDGKRYIPWCYFNDGMWRAMEPDGDLPFWKPKLATDQRKIMVHEGAKAAAAAQEICDDPSSTHPWVQELREYEHWGMIGGALSPHRADYQELFDRNPELLTYVCDNDKPGKEALSTVSRKYRRTMKFVDFDASFPPHWDMADELPQHAKRLQDYMGSCTWATEEIPPEKKGGRPSYIISRHFEREWLHSVDPLVYVHDELPRKLFSEESFNNAVRPFSHVKNTAELLAKSRTSKAAGLRYDPSSVSGKAAGGIYDDYINTYMRPDIKPLHGDCAPWEAYLDHVFPREQDRIEVIRWCATLLRRPQVKMKYGMLLISETQGVGKSTLGEDVLRHLIGEWNYSAPSATEVCESNFNDWCAHKRLAVIHEIYEDYRNKGYERLKSVLTESTLKINAKYMAKYEIDNWLHVIACSNNKKALKIGTEDRRWLIPEVREMKRSREDWQAFHAWLGAGGLSHIVWWFDRWLENNEPVRQGAEAPWTNAKTEVVRENYSLGQELVAGALERLVSEHPERSIVVFDFDLRERIKSQLYNGQPNDRLEKPATIRKVAKGAGWFVVGGRVQLRDPAWTRDGVVHALTNDPDLKNTPHTELKEKHARRELVLVDMRSHRHAGEAL